MLSGAGLWLGGHLPQIASQRGLRPGRSSGFSRRFDQPPPACVGRGQGGGKGRFPRIPQRKPGSVQMGQSRRRKRGRG